MHTHLKLTFTLVALTLAATTSENLADEPLRRIAFGSCIKEQQPMPLLQTIAKSRPELMIMLGDNIYADTLDMDVMRAKYATLKADAGFRKLSETCSLLAVWDDHDFGMNDAGVEYVKKAESQKIFVDFWSDPADSPRRKRPGTYDAHVYGPAGRRVQIILLDIRYFRSPLKIGERRIGGPYYPDDSPKKTMLGETQWKWLGEQLRKPAELRVIASGTQVLAEAAGQETWSNFPRERARLLQLIATTQAEGVLILSGDRHWAEISKSTEHVAYPIYDITSSSINQLHPRGTPTTNRYRDVATTYHRENFGVLEIDWKASDPKINIAIVTLDEQRPIEKQIRLSDLKRAKK